MFIAAALFSEVLRSRSSVSSDEIGLPSAISQSGVQTTFPAAPFGPLFDPEEWYMIMRKTSS